MSQEAAVELDEPPPETTELKVAVQVPAFDEPPDRFTTAMNGIASQEVLDDIELAFEAWVTPTDERETLAAAEAHPVFEAVESPPGKLTTRNRAHANAVNEGADVIVTWDADALPAHKHVLAALLDPLGEEDVVAANGNPRAPRSNPINVFINGIAKVEDRVRPHVHGQLSAITAYGWDQFGGFDPDVDELDVLEVRRHEEFELYRELAELGDVRRVRQAVVLEDPRRPMYHLNKAFDRFNRYPLTEWEADRGATSFEIDDDESG